MGFIEYDYFDWYDYDKALKEKAEGAGSYWF